MPLEESQTQNVWQERQPDLLVLTLPLEENHGQIIRQLQLQYKCSVLIFCNNFDPQALETAWSLQPKAVLVQPVTEPQLIATLHLIRLSRSVFVGQQLKALSPQERKVLPLVLKGFTSKEIGQQLFVSMNTVNTHKRRIKEKLGVRRWGEVKRMID